mmetsp:Transcript_90962/g.278445  ORF Transcript_90962/g.278445 Transcript_90962/m.278445 type:complete len:305 (-) Transcript_90962:593-1507(-)
MTMPTPKNLQRPSKRLARLTGSPRHPNFIFFWHPMLPLRTFPVCMPMRMASCGKPFRLSSWFNASKASCMAKAAEQALAAWSGTSSGVFQKMRRPSPKISVSTPWLSSATWVITDKYRVKMKSKSVGGRDSEIAVKSRMSVNITVTVLSLTCGRMAWRSPRMMLRTMASGTKCENVSMPLDKRMKVFCNSLTSLIKDLVPILSSNIALVSGAKSRRPRRCMSSVRSPSFRSGRVRAKVRPQATAQVKTSIPLKPRPARSPASRPSSHGYPAPRALVLVRRLPRGGLGLEGLAWLGGCCAKRCSS